MRANEFREKTDGELKQLLRDRNDDLMHFRVQSATGVVDNVRASREARKDMARIKTVVNERKRAQASAAAAGESEAS